MVIFKFSAQRMAGGQIDYLAGHPARTVNQGEVVRRGSVCAEKKRTSFGVHRTNKITNKINIQINEACLALWNKNVPPSPRHFCHFWVRAAFFHDVTRAEEKINWPNSRLQGHPVIIILYILLVSRCYFDIFIACLFLSSRASVFSSKFLNTFPQGGASVLQSLKMQENQEHNNKKRFILNRHKKHHQFYWLNTTNFQIYSQTTAAPLFLPPLNNLHIYFRHHSTGSKCAQVRQKRDVSTRKLHVCLFGGKVLSYAICYIVIASGRILLDLMILLLSPTFVTLILSFFFFQRFSLEFQT